MLDFLRPLTWDPVLLLVASTAVLASLAALRWFRPPRVREFGDWAVVTGATDGIGLAYCHELARHGLNVVLISRRQTRLEACVADIQARFPNVETRSIAADFENPLCYRVIAKGLEDVPVGILVNSVGRSYEHAEYLHQLPEERTDSILRLNVVSTTRMCAMVIPGMLERGKGAIVNVSSAAGVIHTGNPLYAVYAASKAYVDFLSRSLRLEYGGHGISVQCHVPYFVATKLAKIRRASLGVPTPETYARSAVACIGYGGATIVPYWFHAIQNWVIANIIPGRWMGTYLLRINKKIRRRALAKNASKKMA